MEESERRVRRWHGRSSNIDKLPVSVSIANYNSTFPWENSEGVPMEYIAIFLALLFPGALVAFNSELLLALQHIAVLRVYCAGIWHNAVFCAACGLALFLLPLILWPFCIHGERVMVLDVESTSPLSGYLSPGDIIVSLDGKSIHNVQQWKETITLIHEWTLHASNHSQNFEHLSMVFNRKGYCVPQPMIANSYLRDPMYDQSACPDGLTDFRGILCVNSSKLDDVTIEEGYLNRRESRYCLNATDVIKLNKCGDVWVAEGTIGSKCSCSQDLLCMSPVQLPGLTWIEINYRSPYSAECLNPGTSSFKTKNMDFIKQNCGGTFVFVGDLISMANSVQVTGYEPRWPFTFMAYLPTILQKILTCAFHVSLALALLNSLPVFFLDGEYILEAALCQFTLLTPRKKEKVLRASLIGGTLISILAVMRVFTSIIFL